MATAFTSYNFKASPAASAQALRTLPDRLSDIFNVKDWGAIGDGVADDTAAIQAAINAAYTTLSGLRGRIVFFPPGLYRIGTPPLYMGNGNIVGSKGLIRIAGSGRDATVITGSYDGGALCISNSGGANALCALEHLSIKNLSTNSSSSCFVLQYADIEFYIDNCGFSGFSGAYVTATASIFGASVRNCIFECIVPIGAANSSSPGPIVGSYGLAFQQGAIVNCRSIGFDKGFWLYAPNSITFGISAYSNSAYRCNTGMYGISADIHANHFDCCTYGIHAASGNSQFAGNVMVGSGPCDPLPINGMTWNVAGANLVEVTTSSTHNITNGKSVHLIGVDPIAFVPSANRGVYDPTNGIVTATVTASNKFTYPGPISSPGSFNSGQWTYPSVNSFLIDGSSGQMFAANALLASTSGVNIDFYGHYEAQIVVSTFMAMHAPYGWRHQIIPALFGGQGFWEFINCNPPPAPWVVMPYDNGYPNGMVTIPLVEGCERTIIDGQTQNSFGGVVTGGSNNHYKIRYDGTNWLRVA